MDPISIREIAGVVGARVETLGGGEPHALDRPVIGVSTDSRAVGEGDLFIPLRGDRFDGHDFIPALAGRVAASVVEARALERLRPGPRAASGDIVLLVVEDALEALHALARHRRAALRARVVGITGSVGKTTVKEFIGQILSAQGPTVRAEKSFNNHIGVPLTLLAADAKTRNLIVEIGTSGPGEIEGLSRLARPDLALVTAVAPAHLAGLGTLDGIVDEKSALFHRLAEGGLAFLPSPIYGERRFRRAISARSGQLIRYGWARNQLMRDGYWITGARPLRDGSGGYQFEVNQARRFELRVPGRHNVFNALAAIAIARELGLDWETIRERIESLDAPPQRLQVSHPGGVTLLDDTYNSSPASFQGAVQTARDLSRSRPGKWYLVLGDFLELGEASERVHRQVGEELARRGDFAGLFTVGEAASLTAREARLRGLPALSFRSAESEELRAELLDRLQVGDGVLFKASRGIELDRAVRGLRESLERRFSRVDFNGVRASRHALLPS